jgi:hypothetical protein
MRTRFQIATLSLALFATAGLSGCLAVAAGAGAAGAVYVMGSLDSTLPGNPEAVVDASEGALKDTDIHVLSKDATGIDGSVVGRTALDTKVEITVKKHDEKSSKISIRVGTFGDKELSQQIYDKIKAKLPSA